MSISIQDGGHSIWGKPRGGGGCCSHPHLAATCWLTSCTLYKDNSVILSAEKQSLQKWAWFKCFWFCRNSSLQYLKMLTFLRWTGHRRIAFISAFSDNIVLRKRLNFSRLTWISKLLMFRRILAFYRAKTKYMDWNNLFVSVSLVIAFEDKLIIQYNNDVKMLTLASMKKLSNVLTQKPYEINFFARL